MSSYNRQPVFPVLMVAAGVVLILGSIFWMMNSTPAESAAGPTDGSPQVVSPVNSASDDIPTQGTPRIPFPDVKRVSVAEAKAAFDSKSAIFVDSRGQLYYDSGHIPEAIPMTDQEVGARMGELDRNAWIITYCT